MSASASAEPPLLPIRKKSWSVEDTCDLVFLRNGEKIRAKVLEIGTAEIRYKLCNMPDGPVFVNRRNEVLMILYSNGTRENFDETTASSTANANGTTTHPVVRKNHPLAVASIALAGAGLLLMLPTSIVALVLAVQSLKEIKAKPKEYEGAPLARAAIILAVVKVLLVTFIIAASIVGYWGW